MAAVSLEIPEAMVAYAITREGETQLIRNAMILYPYIHDRVISHGKAAEILGISKLELINIYEKIGIAYFDQTRDDLDKDMETFKQLGLDKVPV